MKLVVGLGNPTDKYANTRHNVGFDFVDMLIDEYGIVLDTLKHKGIYGKGMIGGVPVMVLKPQTYMNLSGESVSSLANYYKIDVEDIIIIYDDINLDVGRLRIRKKGSAGGHNGIKSIIECLGSSDFPRLRVGIGMKPKEFDLADYVLSRFSNEERELLEKGMKQGMKALELMLMDDIPEAMNRYNGMNPEEL